ncbi:MAG: amylo-alpha-1,6-glucosidase [Anaerolineales bacterium]|jgi:putative isomerase
MQSEAYLLNVLRNKIDITHVPFSDRGSRLLVFQEENQSRLFVKLAERLIGLEPGLEAYRFRPPFLQDISLLDADGNPLEYKTTTFPHAIYFETDIGDFGLVFQDKHTLSFGIPAGQTAGLRFRVAPQFWHTLERGGVLKGIRNMEYQTNGKIVSNRIDPVDGSYAVEILVEADADTAVIIAVRRPEEVSHEVRPFSIASAAAEQRWADWFSRLPMVEENLLTTYAYSWWVMANNLISPQGNVAYEAMFPSKIKYVGLWLWDSAMHALAFRHVDAELARNQIRAMLAYQLPDGMLPDAIHDEGIISEIDHPLRAEVTKPPILAWAAMKLHEMDPDPGFLQEIYMPLVRWNAWWFSMNDDDVDGLVQYNHPYSSGLDDSPLWDEGMPVESPDLNTYLCVQMGSLALMAEELGLDRDGAMWRRRAKAIVDRMIADMWNEQDGYFKVLLDNQPIDVLTPFNLYPLWTGQLPAEMNQRLIAHLTNPEEFWTEFPLPSVARNDPKYDPNTMWRGPVWVNINYFFIEALRQIGEHQLAADLRRKTLELVLKQPNIWEYYNPETGGPADQADPIFGWTAAVFIDLALQEDHPSVT